MMKLKYLSTLLLIAFAVSIATLLMTDSFAIRDMHHRFSSNANGQLSFPGLRVRPSTTMDSNSKPTILELVGDSSDYQCPDGLVLVKDSIDPSFYEKSERKIPKVVHMTSKTRCMTKLFAENIDKWRFKGHSLFLHDDDAVDRLLKLHWPEFPQLHTIMKCMLPGASIADLWRYLLLWEYGGIYTDIDNRPGPWFGNNETDRVIADETDALFEQEREGFPSQYFFASSPHHPIMFLAVYQTMHRVMDLKSVKQQYIPFVTGPGAIKSAFVRISFILKLAMLFCSYEFNILPFFFQKSDYFCWRRWISNSRSLSRRNDKKSYSHNCR